MARRFEVLPGRDGRWLVRHGRRRFVVPDDLAEHLHGPDAERWWRALLSRHVASAPSRRRARGLWLRITLIPARGVCLVARGLAPLASTHALTCLTVVGLLALVVVPPPAGVATSWLGAAAVFLVTAVAHEFGHAAALCREGWPPGSVGVGLLWVLPVCWCDVSAVALVPRRGRVRVDLAGVAFQLGAAGLAVIAAAATGEAALSLGARLALAAVTWNLLPLARTDGYWLACDLLELPDLEAPLTGNPGRGRRLATAAWRTLTAVLLAAITGLLVWRVRDWLLSWDLEPAWLAMLIRGLLAGVLVVGTLRAARRIIRLGLAAGRDLRSRLVDGS